MGLQGGAFLLEVDPLTSVRQVKDILSQMQNIPISQQNLVFRRKTLHDDALLSHCGVQEGSSLSLVCRSPPSSWPIGRAVRFTHSLHS